jgi:hypothetical protein
MSDLIDKIEQALSDDDNNYSEWFREEKADRPGRWKELEKAPVGEDIPIEGVGFITKVYEGIGYHEGAYETDVELVFQVNMYEYYRVDGIADSYGSTLWDTGAVQVFPEQVIQTIYKAR